MLILLYFISNPCAQCHSTYVWHVSLKWLPNYKCKSHSQHTKWAHRFNIFEHLHQNTINCSPYFKCYCEVCARNKYTLQIWHRIYKISDGHVWKMCTYVYHIWSHYNYTCKKCIMKYSHVCKIWSLSTIYKSLFEVWSLRNQVSCYYPCFIGCKPYT